MRGDLYRNLTPWQRVQVARHPARPTTLDYVERLFTDFVELHGDRRFADDHAIVTGTAALQGPSRFSSSGTRRAATPSRRSIATSATRAPTATARRCGRWRLAQKFQRPIICFVDTPAAYPGIESEERGVAEAIALNLREMAMLEVPVIVLVHGEGGSGGALGIAVGDRILMHEFAIYSVIPPEGCAAILWRDPDQEGRSGRGAEDHRAGSAAARHHRRDHQRAGRRRAHGSDAGRRARRRRARARSPRSRRWTSRRASTRATTSSARWARSDHRKPRGVIPRSGIQTHDEAAAADTLQATRPFGR